MIVLPDFKTSSISITTFCFFSITFDSLKLPSFDESFNVVIFFEVFSEIIFSILLAIK